MKFQLD